MTVMTALTETQRAQENRAYVRQLLRICQPAFAAALAIAERDFCCPACPCLQQKMITRQPSRH